MEKGTDTILHFTLFLVRSQPDFGHVHDIFALPCPNKIDSNYDTVHTSLFETH
jgi:hypothetical protein